MIALTLEQAVSSITTDPIYAVTLAFVALYIAVGWAEARWTMRQTVGCAVCRRNQTRLSWWISAVEHDCSEERMR